MKKGASNLKKLFEKKELYILPSDNKELQSYVKKYKKDMMHQVISSIELAHKKKLQLVEVFQFKNSDYVVILTDKEFEENLDNIYQYFLSDEQYETCSNILKLKDKIKIYGKTKKEPRKSRSTNSRSNKKRKGT